MPNIIRIKAGPAVTSGRFCRAGRCFGTVAQDFAEGDFTKEELARLRAEPMLVVEIIAAPQPKQAASKPDARPDTKPDTSGAQEPEPDAKAAEPKVEAAKSDAKPAVKENGK